MINERYFDMKSKKTILIICSILALFVLGQVAYTYANHPDNYADQPNSLGYLLGQIVKKYKVDNSQTDNSLYAKTGGIEITLNDINYYKAMSALSENPLNEKDIVKKIVTDKLL